MRNNTGSYNKFRRLYEKMALELKRAINFEEEKAIYKRICAYSRENNVPIITAKQTNKHSIVLNVDVE